MTIALREQAATFGLTAAEFDRVTRLLGRQPNGLEAAMLGALWSEHCGYKNSKPLLRRLPTEGPQVLQGPGENAGVVDIGDGWAACFKMESHNHPSAVEPVQGAATGVGGILRDIFAMGARPVAVLDALCFGPLSSVRARHLLAGVVEGISLYGNAIGVPTVGGEIGFHACYEENPLVNVMAVGLLRHADLQRAAVGEVGNRLIYLGSKTGRDGLGGAVFASADLSEGSAADRPAVQVGDPFMEKLLLEACLEAIGRDLVVGVQDMGAAGLTSSVGEMAQRAELGVDLWLERVPRREAGMSALEVMLSESQERMVLSVRPEDEAELLALLEKWELDAVVVGEVAGHGLFRVLEHGRVAAEIPVHALSEAPTYTRRGVESAEIKEKRGKRIDVPMPEDLGAVLLSLLGSPDIASKRAVYERYDTQVRTSTVVLPGEADAAVLRVKGTTKGIALAADCNERYCYLDPYEGAKLAVAEAARNVACVGARPLAITNNLNFGNPERPDVYYQLERAVEGLKDACLALNTPVTGGNVSLYNQYRAGGTLKAIHPTPTVGMVGLLPDISKRATQGFKRAGDVIVLLGENTGELGASAYLACWHDLEAGHPPQLDLEREKLVQDAAISLIQGGLCDTAHDCSEGGLAVALAEMVIAGRKGASMVLMESRRADALLFGEAPSRIVIALIPEHLAEAEALLQRMVVPYTTIGRVTAEPELSIELLHPHPTSPIEGEGRLTHDGFRLELAELTEAFERPLHEALA